MPNINLYFSITKDKQPTHYCKERELNTKYVLVFIHQHKGTCCPIVLKGTVSECKPFDRLDITSSLHQEHNWLILIFDWFKIKSWGTWLAIKQKMLSFGMSSDSWIICFQSIRISHNSRQFLINQYCFQTNLSPLSFLL